MTRMFRTALTLAVGGLLLAAAPAGADPDDRVGVNILLSSNVSDEVVDDLALHGEVLDVFAEIRGVTMLVRASDIAAIENLPYVSDMGVDSELEAAAIEPLPLDNLSGGASHFDLDMMNITDSAGRAVPYDGSGVYVAVLDSGLSHNWRAYFPEERIATEFARAFGGGGGQGTKISEQPNKWEGDPDGHGTTVTSGVLGFAYQGPDAQMADYWTGAAPGATVIPVRVGFSNNNHSGHWESVMVRAILYVTGLKTSGALGDSPLVINLSNGLHRPLLMERAAIDYAIANGVIVVAAAGNEGAQGMRSPGRYAEVISVASSGWDASFPADDPTYYRWIGRDLPEGLSGHHVSPTSSRALPGQDLDVVAPGLWVPVPYTVDGKEDYSFVQGTSHSAPRVAGLIALMLQKNPNLDQAAVEAILESTATPLAPACADIQWPTVGPGNSPVWGDDDQVSFFTLNTCWDASATGAGVTLADMVLAGTPLP